ncbi:peptide deformylase [Saccharicrinis sp. FJH62]|uniref:peptide deformylase n=1 Tax=Saccharicrinis sp. FJH62 TaxID=3344657 RepID=UPI0035D410E7
MRLPILSLGHKILKEKCENINPDYPNLNELISDMWETMQKANGCGLAAPQIGQPIRLFIVDSKSTYDNIEESDRKAYYGNDDKGITETFINAKIIKHSGHFWEDEEGCLSIPDLSQPVKRPWTITIEYDNPYFEKQIRTYSGTTARIVQHEYDHTEGILYIDHLKPLRKRLMDAKLKRIIKGQVKTKYPIKFVKNARH